jgi:hypothetical protein
MRPAIAVLCSASVMALVCAAGADAMTIDELVAKNTEARGGASALHAMQSLRLSGKLLINNGQFELAFVQSFKRPFKLRQEASLQGMTQTQAYNGVDGWQIDPFGGRKDPERMSADDIKSLAEATSEFDGALVDWKAKGALAEYLGTEDVDGTLAHKVKLSRAGGDVEYVWLDPDHFLEIRTLSQRVEHGVQLAIETDLGDYEKVDGVFLPFAIESGKKGSNDRQKIVIEKAEVNPVLDDAMFIFPVTAAAKK